MINGPTKFRNTRAALYVLTASLGLALPAVVNAAVISGDSSAYGASVNLTVDPVVGVSGSVLVGPVSQAQGTSPGAYNNSDSVLNLSVDGLLTTGVLDANASSDVDGGPGAHFAMATSSVDSFALSLLNVLGLGLDTISSTANVNGDYGALAASGSTLIEGLTLNGAPLLEIAPDPNTVLLNALGISVILNEQQTNGDSISSLDMAVNALHVSFNNVLGLLDNTLGLINGDIIIGHSDAQLLAAADPAGPGNNDVPAPAGLSLLGLGLVGIGIARRKRLS